VNYKLIVYGPQLRFATIGVARTAPQIFSISSHFVLWETASQTKILLIA